MRKARWARPVLEAAAAGALVAGWLALQWDHIDSAVPVRTETFTGSPYAVLIVVGFGLVVAFARRRPEVAAALLGILLVSQLLFWPTRFSQTGWIAYLILLPVPYLLASVCPPRRVRVLLIAVIVGAVSVAALLTLPSASMSGVWGTINGKPWESSQLLSDVATWTVVCVGVAVGMWALGRRASRRTYEPAVNATEADRTSALPNDETALNLLTPREREIFTLVAGGMSNAEIAQAAFIAETTVKTHVSSVHS